MSVVGEEVQPLCSKESNESYAEDFPHQHFAWEQEVERQPPLGQSQYARWRRMALIVCAVSIVCEVVIGIVSLVFGLKKQSVGTIGFSLDAFLDILTTFVVVWRFLGKGEEADSWQREALALQAFGILFILSGIGLSIKAIRDLILERKPNDPLILAAICASSFFVFAFLAGAKWFVGGKARSRSLKLDALNSACCSTLAAMLLLSLLIFNFTDVWQIGHSLSLIVAAFLMVYGTWCVWSTMRKPMLPKHNTS